MSIHDLACDFYKYDVTSEILHKASLVLLQQHIDGINI